MNTEMNEEGDESSKYSEISEDSSESYIAHLLTYLKYLRVWHRHDQFSISKLFFINFAIAILLTANFILVISELLMVPGDPDIERFSNTINPLGLHMSGLVKWIYCLCKSKKIDELVTSINRCYLLSKKIDFSHDYDVSKKEMEKVYKNSRMWLYGWVWFCVYGTIHWCFNALFQKLYINMANVSENDTLINANPLPYITWCPWSTENSYGYAYAFIIQLVGAISSAIGVTCYDCFHVSIFMVICGQLRCLYSSLIEIDSIDDARKIEGKLETKLRDCVDHHTAILKISQDLENFANIPMFIQCVETIVVICLISFEMSITRFSTDSEAMTKLFSLIEYFSALSLQLYIFCFYATRIRFLSLKISDSVYACGWEQVMWESSEETNESKRSSRRMKHLMLLLLLRAQIPIVMKGGPFYVLSLETFKSVMSLAISNAVILRQLSEY